MKPPPIPVPLRPASPNWRSALGGIWRLAYPRFFSIQAMVMPGILILVLGLISWVAVEDWDSGPFYSWISVFYLGGVVPVLAYLSGASAVRDDMEPGPVDYILTRPVKRTVFLVSRYLCHMICLQGVYVFAFAVLIIVGVQRDIPDLASSIPMLFLAQVLAIVAFTALGTLAGAFTSRYLIVGLLYGGIVEVGIGNTPIQINRLSILNHIRGLVESVVGDESLFAVSTQSAFATTVFILVVGAGAVAVATLLFSIREFAGEQAKEG